MYRTGEKTFPLLKPLSQKYDLSVLFAGEMTKFKAWPGTVDARPTLYSFCDKNNITQYHMPKISRNTTYETLKDINVEQFDLIFIDDNYVTKTNGYTFVYDYLKHLRLKIMACPHGNSEYEDFDSLKRKMRLFVFGPKDKRNIKCGNKELICGGIPSNDSLRKYNHEPKHILFISSIITVRYEKLLGFRSLTPDLFRKMGIIELGEEENCEIIFKCKTRHDSKKQTLRDYDCMSQFPMTMVCDVPNVAELIAQSKYVISCPSTLTFKSIQMGIPTVVLNGFGAIGSLYDFPGLCSPDKKSIFDTLEKEIHSPKHVDFIEDTLTGGLNFNSTEYYMSAIEQYLQEKI